MARKLAWHALFVLAAIAVGTAFSYGPWQLYREQREKAHEAAAQMKEAERARADLIRTRNRYDSPIGREELARERGYRRPNERPLEEAR
jgi:cytochrome oxidase assembly protein ShyY1